MDHNIIVFAIMIRDDYDGYAASGNQALGDVYQMWASSKVTQLT